MRANQFITESTGDGKERFIEMFSKFLPLAMQYLKLDSLPKIVFKKKIKSTGQPTFGMYVTGENILYVALANRHPNDILRTVAHELLRSLRTCPQNVGCNHVAMDRVRPDLS